MAPAALEKPPWVFQSPLHSEVVPISETRSVARCLVHLLENRKLIEGEVHQIPSDFWFGHFPKAIQSKMTNQGGQNWSTGFTFIEKAHTRTLTHLYVGYLGSLYVDRIMFASISLSPMKFQFHPVSRTLQQSVTIWSSKASVHGPQSTTRVRVCAKQKGYRSETTREPLEKVFIFMFGECWWLVISPDDSVLFFWNDASRFKLPRLNLSPNVFLSSRHTVPYSSSLGKFASKVISPATTRSWHSHPGKPWFFQTRALLSEEWSRFWS